MYAGRYLGQNEAAPSSQVATLATAGAGLAVCPVAVPVFLGFGPANFLAIYRMAYEQALADLAARPTLYDRLQTPCWN